MDFDINKNYYDILWVKEDASLADIKKAFKQWAVKHHPDRWGDKKKFQEINEAYQVIGDEKKKAQYDAYRKWGFGGWANFGGFGGFSWGQWNFDFGDFDIGDIMWGIFGGWFGWWSRTKKAPGGEDIQVGIDITFEESYLWVHKKISYSRMKKIAGVEEKTCDTCKWRGSVVQQIQTPFGTMQSTWACPNCGGVGKIFTKDGRLLAHGWLEKVKDIMDISIPAGIKSGAYIKFTGKGNESIGQHVGDLYIQINVAKSKMYERKEDNLYTKASVSLFDMVLWWEVSVDHPEWKLKVKIPKGTQIGDMIKIAGKGFGNGGMFARKWDMYIIPHVDIPKKLSKDQEKLWTELKGKK